MIETRRRLPATPQTPSEARRVVQALLQEAALEEDLVHTVVLLTSEVVTNAVVHAQTPIDLEVFSDPPQVRVEVWDHAPGDPEPRRDGETSGRGLMLVDLLSTAWGVLRRPDGKCVWFEVRA